jgi:myo-inositol-1(or 4)-monophosphatase
VQSTDIEARLRPAESILRDAGGIAADYFARRATLAVDRKGAQDLVSEADRACEDFIVAALARAFPEDGFLGEEGGRRGGAGEALWVIDPIDGTHNFLTGIPFWCLSLGLVAGGETVAGLIYDPVHGEMFSAMRGSGALLNGAPMRVSGETDPRRARLCVGFSYRRAVADHVAAIEACLSAGCEYLRLGSGALALAYVAAGRFDGYWERHMNAWDAAAGIALVREAGGWENGFLSGNALTEGNEILAATPALVGDFRRLTGLGARS